MGGLVTGCWCLDLGLVSAASLLLLYLWIRHRYRYFERRGIPYHVPRTFLSNTLFGAFLPEGKSTGEVYDEVYRQYKSAGVGCVGFFHLLSPAYILISPDLVLQTTVTDFQAFNDHGLPADEKLNPLEGNLFFLKGPKWRALRRKLTPTFTSGKLKWMFGLMDECARRLVAALETEAGAGGELEMRDILARFTTDVIGSCAFGIDSESLKDPDSEFRRMGREFFNPPLSLKLKAVCRFTAPGLYRRLGVRSGQPRVENFFRSIIGQALERRLETGERRNDLVQLLLQLRETGSIEMEEADDTSAGHPEEERLQADEPEPIKLELTDEVLTAQAFVFFVAGFETTASTLSYCLYLLAKHQDVQDRARREVNRVLSTDDVTYDALKEMHYLEACIQESLRLYPPIQLLPRTCTEDCRLADGTPILKGQRVIIPIFSLHRDPDYYPEPLEYRPERFTNGSPPPRPGTFIPFGYGPRICIGQRFAILETKLCLALMLANFKFRLGPSMSETLKLSSPTFVAVPTGGIKLVLERLPAELKKPQAT